MKGLLAVLLLILTFTPPAYAADFQDGKVALTIESKAIIKGGRRAERAGGGGGRAAGGRLRAALQ